MDVDDREIMRQVQQGRFPLFEELVRRYRGPLLRVAANKLGDAVRAEDVVQEAFLAVFAARKTYKPEFSFRTWLWTILLNLCRRELSKRAKRPTEVVQSTFSGASGQIFPEPATEETGLTNAIRQERKQLLANQLNRLPEVQADAIRLRFFGGLKYSEIAQTMGGSEITAKVRVRNGLAALARRLQIEAGDSP